MTCMAFYNSVPTEVLQRAIYLEKETKAEESKKESYLLL